jgi:predicted porin
MKKTICSAAALVCGLASSGAIAQTTVQVYGLVDTGVEYVTNVNAKGDSVVRMPSITGTFPSRIGFRGTEDLGNGLQAFFVLENGFALDQGTLQQGGRIFGRQSYVGLKGKWGALTFGRQFNMTTFAVLKSDVLGPNVFAIGSIDSYLPNARSDNSVAYMGNFDGFVVGATYSLGRDASNAGGPAATNCAGEVPGNAKACRQYTGLLGYETQAWGVNVSYDRMYGNTGAAGGLTSSANTDTHATVGGYIMVGTTKIGAGVVDRDLNASTGTTKSDIYYAGVTQPIGSFVIDAQWAKLNTRHSNADATMLVARLSYALSKRTSAYTSVGRIDNSGASAAPLDAGGTVGAGMTQNGVMIGLRHTF